jgi:hypothetical protein
MDATFAPGQGIEAPATDADAVPFVVEPVEIGALDLGFQVGLWDPAGLAAMATPR